MQAIEEKHRPDCSTLLSLQLVQRPLARQVPPPLEAAPQLRGQAMEVGGGGSAVVGRGSMVGEPVGQLSQATGHRPVKCGQRSSRLAAVIDPQGLAGSASPPHVATKAVGVEVGGADEQLSQTAGHRSVKCRQRSSRLAAVIDLQGLAGSTSPPHTGKVPHMRSEVSDGAVASYWEMRSH